MADNITRESLEERKSELQEECEKLNKIISASDTSTFEIMIEDIKKEMMKNIAEENWKILKQNKNKVEKFRDIVKIIQNQDELLQSKQDEMEEIQWKLDHWQKNFFEGEEKPIAPESVDTGYLIREGEHLYVGDVYRDEKPNADGVTNFYSIINSNDLSDSFAIISTAFGGERLLQYPSNQKILSKGQVYIGNIYVEDDDQNNAVTAFELITQNPDGSN